MSTWNARGGERANEQSGQSSVQLQTVQPPAQPQQLQLADLLPSVGATTLALQANVTNLQAYGAGGVETFNRIVLGLLPLLARPEAEASASASEPSPAATQSVHLPFPMLLILVK